MKWKFQDLILYEDNNFLVVNKPPFLSTLQDRNDPQNLQALAKSYNPVLSTCHRLDKETSGAVLMAKNEDAYRHASIQFEERKIEKTYHAAVDGLHSFANVKVELPILPSSKGMVRIDHRKGKESTTGLNTLEMFKFHSLIECKPLTGRMHQIRIHLSTQKAPIINDNQYGGKTLFLSKLKKNYNLKTNSEEQPLIKRFALHAHKLIFNTFSEQIEVVAEYPKDMRVLLKQLRQNR